MGTKLLDFQTGRGVATIFGRRVPRNAGGALRNIRAAFSTFQSNDDARALRFGHNLLNLAVRQLTQLTIFA
jgi:hypothetical protein